MTVDFHSHTTASDGTSTPAELVERMRARGVSWFSITDHDSLRAYDEISAPGQHLVRGVEINTSWDGDDVHILGYRLPVGDSPVAEVIAHNRAYRRERIDVMVRGLNRAGYALSIDEVLAEAPDGDALGRPHVARALVRLGLAKDIESAFRRLLSRGTPGYAPSTHITPLQAIDVIKQSGGVPVLAHPGRLGRAEILDELAEYGVVGLEVFYATHTAQQTAHFRSQAARYGLVMTAGSDFHDGRWNTRGVGIDVDPADIGPFLDLVA